RRRRIGARTVVEPPRGVNARGARRRPQGRRLRLNDDGLRRYTQARMAGLFSMWRHTPMVVLTGICAALYAALLIPFKVVPLIPGVTEFRPANAIPVVCSFLFGPAAAWGAAFGNLIGDFFGGLGPGDLFGFFANLLYGLVPYAVWQAITDAPPLPRGPLE